MQGEEERKELEEDELDGMMEVALSTFVVLVKESRAGLRS